jgi:DNA mismatch repair protein MutL
LPPVASDLSMQNRIRAVEDRFAALYSRDIPLVAVDFSSQIEDRFTNEDGTVEGPETVSVWGIIGAPGVSRSTRDDQHLFVNRRPVENRGLNFALVEGYHTMLMKGRYPLCCLFLQINPALVDVNIHPAKREVKFRQEPTIRRVVSDAVRDALLKHHNRTETARPVLPKPAPHPTKISAESFALKNPEPPPETRSFPNFVPLPPNRPISSWPRREEVAPPQQSAPPPVEMTEPASAPARINLPPPKPVPLLEVPLRILGVIGRLYVVLESDRGLVLLDQHAAHERVLFEQMLNRVQQGEAPSQRLLLPETSRGMRISSASKWRR